MATTSIETRPQLAPAVQWTLGSLRTWIRCYVWLDGLAAAVAWLGAAFWGTLAIDWFFEPPAAVRVIMLAVAGCVLAGLLLGRIGRRAFVRLSDSNMATLLERRYGQLDDSLLTAVVLTQRHADPSQRNPAQCNPEMLERTCRQAARRIQEVGLPGVFDPAPLLRSLTSAVLLAGSVAAFVLLCPDAFGTWMRRSLAMSGELWPRKTLLEIEGFDRGVEKVARGADFEVIAMAHTRWPDDQPHGRLERPVVPQTIQVRYRIEGGRRDRESMSRIGVARPDRHEFQKYAYTFQGVLSPITFDLIGGDARIKDLRIQVVDSPTIDRMELDYYYPQYMGRGTRTFPFTGVMEVPLGTQIVARAEANKQLVGVRIEMVRGEESLAQQVLEAADLATDGRSFQHALPPLYADATLLFTLSDTDGITGREPFRLALVAIADELPQLAARLHGIGQAITAKARLPVVGEVTDDYGIRRVWFESKVDDEAPAEHEIGAPSDRPLTLKLDPASPRAALEVEPLGLTPSQKLLVTVKAVDHYDLAEEPNIGSSERWLLEVVTPEQLRSMLEQRELVLRQRFERIIQEVTETRDLLMRIEFGVPPADEKKETDKETAEEKAADGSEPGDEPSDEPAVTTPERQLVLRTRHAQLALQNSRKNAHETRGVAEAFDDVRRQFVNNQIHNQELVIRLEQRIADPLHRIADERFLELQLSLARLTEKLEDDVLGPRRCDLAREKADDVLLEMHKVLEEMIELEDFNEALELLRAIIELQEQLGEETKQRHKQKLLED